MFVLLWSIELFLLYYYAIFLHFWSILSSKMCVSACMCVHACVCMSECECECECVCVRERVCVCVCVCLCVCVDFVAFVYLLIKIRSSEHGFSLFIISFATLIARTRCRIVQALPTVPPHATNKSNTRNDIRPCTHEQHDTVSVQALSGRPQPQERYAQGHELLPRTHTHTHTNTRAVCYRIRADPAACPAPRLKHNHLHVVLSQTPRSRQTRNSRPNYDDSRTYLTSTTGTSR